MVHLIEQSRKVILSRFRELMGGFGDCTDLDLKHTVQLGGRKVRVPPPLIPLQILLGGEKGNWLHFCPEARLTRDGQAAESGVYLLFDPEQFFSGIAGFVRLLPGDSLVLGRDDPFQSDLLGFTKAVGGRHLGLQLPGNGLILKDKAEELGTCIAPLMCDGGVGRFVAWRRRKLERLAEILPGPLEPLARDEAQDLLEAAIDGIEREPLQSPDSNGQPGGVVVLPNDVNPIFVGDLHARIDNLLVVLTQNGFLEGLEDGSAALILLGDAVHSDEDGMEDRMDTSMLIMDFIFRLMLRFPGRVFYLRGNHDSYAEDISKNGVPQALMWERALRETRGAKYATAMARLYASLPYVALSQRFVACHAGAPTGKVSRNLLVNLRQYPKLQKEINHIRLRKPNSPSGYGRGEVKRLRASLGLDPDTPFIVGHTPITSDDTLWLNVADIPHHHVLFGAHPDRVGVIALVGKRLLPLRYPTEPLSDLFNRFVTTGRSIGD